MISGGENSAMVQQEKNAEGGAILAQCGLLFSWLSLLPLPSWLALELLTLSRSTSNRRCRY
jgi:hypothetical protein